MAPACKNSNDLLTALLRDVSRSFYWTMRVLPRGIRPQISLAYLLARTTDTIADTEIVPVAERLAALRELQARILGKTSAPLDFARFLRSAGPATPTAKAERILLARVEESLAVLSAFSADDQGRIRQVLDTITGGQVLDLERFGAASLGTQGAVSGLLALQTNADLDDYTYRVAGCVGEFWTKMCRTHLFPTAPLNDALLLANGVRFGKGLQLVNILRDLPADLRRGCCYLPEQELRTAGLSPADLLQPSSETRARLVYDGYLELAKAHLAAGWAYTNTLPRRQVRVRLACAWPILIGRRTLDRLRQGRILDPEQRIKISRAEVRTIFLHSILACPFPGIWKRLFEE